jgi:hypothetical protein
VSNWPPTTWKEVGRLGPASSTQKRTRSPTRAANIWSGASYWLAIPLKVTKVGASAAIAWGSTSAGGVPSCPVPGWRCTSDWTTTYSRSTSGSPSSGSMITAPCMPAEMWLDMGIVEQWYIQMPARVAVNR